MMPRTSQRAVLGALLVTALALVLRAPAAAQDGGGEDTILYTIQVGDTCYGIAQRFFGNPRQCHEVIYRYNPHMGSDASNIRPGVTITIPVRNPNAPDARVTRTARDVQARSSSSADWRSARRGLGLYRGWHVSTEESASAEVTFRDESQIQMRENTLVIIYGGTAENTARRRTSQATLERGTLRSRLGDLRLQVATPSGETELNGGSSVVTVDGKRAAAWCPTTAVARRACAVPREPLSRCARLRLHRGAW
jgi:phage tail protein X